MSNDTNPLFQMLRAVTPVLAVYTRDRIMGELWHRPGLSSRDRSIVTLSALVARNVSVGIPHYVNLALDSGLTPAELSELLTHLAFYAGWPHAIAAIAVVRDIFAQRGIDAGQLPEVNPELLPDEGWAGPFIDMLAFPALQHFTETLLHGEVWRRPGLAPRDRSLATFATLAALGQADLFAQALNGKVLHDFTRGEMDETLVHVAFYAGWGNAMEAARVAERFFGNEDRS